MNKPKSFISRLRRLISLPRKLINTRMRLAFGLACSVASALFVAQYIGLLPDPNQGIMNSRKLQTETLAMTGSALAETRTDLKNFKGTLENTVNRVDDLISIGLRSNRNELLVEVGPHKNNWNEPKNGRSTDQFMFVPIYRAGKQFCQLEMCYTPLGGGLLAILQSTIMKLALFLFGVCFLFFNFILYRTLKQLDPRGAVPRRVREAFDTMAEGLLILDRKGTIVLANSKFGSLVGIDPEKLMANSISDLPWELQSEQLPWQTAIETKQPISDIALQICDVNGVNRTFKVSAAPVMGGGGNSRGVIVTFDDITLLQEQKRELTIARKAADDANEAKSNFLSRMSHEIRTPMNAIIGYTDILQEGNVEQKDQVRYLTTIQSSGEHLLTLINDILDLSKVEAGQMTIERRPIQIVPMLTQVIETLNVKASEKNLILSLEIDGKVPHLVETDDTRLRQVLINTIGNAIKFTNDGGVRLVTRLTEIENRTMLQFDVVDTGIGMSQKALKTIFDPFTQADDSVTRKFGGTGLGLSISKQLSEALGGGVSVQSEEGVGTTFTVTVDPGEIQSDVRWITNETLTSEQEMAPAQHKTVERKLAGGHVLIVDDGKANRDLAALMLKRMNLTYDMATNGLEALQRIAENDYDVVLMDMNMPVMDGMTATRHLREAGSPLPVIALTALAVDEEKKKCLAAGCSDFLAKPIRQEPLLDTLAKYLEVIEVPVEAKPPKKSQKKDAPAAVTPETSENPVRERQHSDIELSINETLASLGLEEEEANEAPSSTTNEVSPAGLTLPDVVRTSLPDDPELQTIASDFADRLVVRVSDFDDAFAANNMGELRSLGHWLAGAAGTVGFDDFVGPAREIEHSDDDNTDRVRVLIDHINALCGRIQSFEIA